MITRILVPTDFSPVADNALRYALRFAKKTGAQVQILHVMSIPVTDAYFVSGAYPMLIDSMEKTAKHGFEKLKKKYFKGAEAKFQATTLTGDVFSEIHSYAKKEKTDLIVMGTSGTSGVSEILFGSNAATVVAKSEIPVLVIPPDAAYHSLKNIVYATDYGEPEFPSVSRLIYLAELYKAAVTVLHVKSELDEYFDTSKNFFVRNKKNISYKNWKMVNMGEQNVMKGIDRFIQKEKSDMLVVAKHNLSFFDKLFHRSLSKRMAYHTHIPLLVLNKSNK